MTTLLQTSFESDATGALPTGWASISGTWVVAAVDPVTGANGMVCSTNGLGHFLVYSGTAVQAYQKLTVSQKLVVTPSSSVDNYKGFAVRCAANGSSGYLLLPKSTGAGTIGILAYKISGPGSYTQNPATTATVTGFASGDVLIQEIIANGTTIECRIWKSTGARPTSPTLTFTDASYASGHIGVYNSLASSTAVGAFDDVVYENDATVTPAANITITGPSSGMAGAPSNNFTVGADGAISGTVVVTPSDSGAGGTFSPTSASISSSSATATFTYLALSAGAKSISVTNNAGLGNPSSLAYTAASAGAGSSVFLPTNANIFFSPYNWYSDGAGALQANNIRASSTVVWANMRGAYLKFKATGTTAIALAINTATLAAVNAAGCPQIAWSVNGSAPQSQLLASGATSLALAAGLTSSLTYEVFVWFRGVYITQDGDTSANYTTPNNRVQITSVNLDAGGTLSMPNVKPYRQASFGDSITEGDLSNGGPRSATSQDANLVYPWYLAEALNAEVGIIGFYGKTFSWFTSSWSSYANGVSRLIGGALSPAPDYITINYGENDGNPGPASSTVASTLAAVSAAAPTAKMFLFVPFSGKARTNLSAASLPSNARLIDLARYEMTPGNTQWSYDGQHPNAKGHANLGALAAGAIVPLLSGFGTTLAARTVTMTLRGADGALAANLNGIQVSVVDNPARPVGEVVRYQSTTASTNSAGVLAFNYPSSLASGGTCGVDIVIPSDKRNMAVSVVVA